MMGVWLETPCVVICLSKPHKTFTLSQTAQLAGTCNAWSKVKDFKWLRAQQSPHWSVLPEEERKGQGVAVERAVERGTGKEGGEEEEEEI